MSLQAGLFYLPSIGSRAEIEQGMAGVRPDLYQRMLAELKEQAVLGDELGYDAIAFTEHHFHIEGFEASTNPVMLDLFVAMHTKRIRVGQLGIVLPASNPIRVAEDIAILDHMTGGRAFAGFARGYQRRWVDTLAGPYRDVHATSSTDDEVDRLNREAFEEFFQIIKTAWTQDTFSYQGKFWRIPAAETPWPLETTRRYGRGVDDEGRLTEIGIVPRPLQQPHPPLMQPFAFSEATIRWCARENVTPVIPPVLPASERFLFDVYHDEAQKNGRDLEPGEGMALLRDVIVCDTDEEAWALHRNSGAFAGAAWFAPFGFLRGLESPERDHPWTAQELADEGLIFVGSVDTVTRQVETLLKRLPAQYIMAWNYNGLVPHEKLMRSIELFKTKVLPRFDSRKVLRKPTE
jgi:alkanesulfonate monooxygenase SsuD/methylene tetrahydromethanopterin reductase-like flavin-dependent oxidoreductase (luciferase family)